MSQQIEFVGKSGARYRYTTLDEARFLPPAGANYVIAQRDGEAHTIIMVGETDNLSGRIWRADLDSARDRYGDVEVLTRLNVKSAVRREELDDMIGSYKPPMNRREGNSDGSTGASPAP